MPEISEQDSTRGLDFEKIKELGNEELITLISKLYTQEETRIREKGIETMMTQYLIRKWIPEYKYNGYDKDYAVHDFKSAMLFTLKMYKSIRDTVKRDNKYYVIINKSINRSIDKARHRFVRRKNTLIELNKLLGYSENELKNMIINKKIDFINFDLNAAGYVIRLYSKIHNTK